MSNETIIIAEEGKQELFIKRLFNASVEKVYEAFSRPEILVRFFAPKGIHMQFLDTEYKAGQFYRYRHTDGSGKILCTFSGVVHEMTYPERIIITSEFEEIPEKGQAVLEIYEFEAQEDGTTLLTIQDVCRSVAVRDAMINSGMGAGVIAIFNRLDEILAA